MTRADAGERDGVRMAILSSRIESIARKMQNTLFRTARSGVLNTAHDFSCVILTADCRLLAAAESLPIHIMIGPDLMCRGRAAASPRAASAATPSCTTRPTTATRTPPTTA